jgi:hypothetical protein
MANQSVELDIYDRFGTDHVWNYCSAVGHRLYDKYGMKPSELGDSDAAVYDAMLNKCIEANIPIDVAAERFAAFILSTIKF